jgi:hypothetical protein
MKKNLLTLIISLAVLITILHATALYFYFYWDIWWFDILMHFLGGFTVGLLAYFIWFPSAVRTRLLYALFSVIVAGIAWEAYEYRTGLTYVTDNYALDTTFDFLMNVAGALSAFVYTTRISRRLNAKKQ